MRADVLYSPPSRSHHAHPQMPRASKCKTKPRPKSTRTHAKSCSTEAPACHAARPCPRRHFRRSRLCLGSLQCATYKASDHIQAHRESHSTSASPMRHAASILPRACQPGTRGAPRRVLGSGLCLGGGELCRRVALRLRRRAAIRKGLLHLRPGSPHSVRNNDLWFQTGVLQSLDKVHSFWSSLQEAL